MRVAIAGCGYWGSKHARILHSIDVIDEVVMVDPNPARRTSLAGLFSGCRSFADLGEALPLVDAVIVATPPSTHIDVALRTIRAGKHVLVEKPMATSVSGAERLILEAATTGVVLMVGHTFEYNAAVWKLRDFLGEHALGKLHYIDCARLNLGLYQQDVNVVWDLAPHDISILNFLLGAKPETVEAWTSRHAHDEFEDVAFVRLLYPRINVSAYIHVSWLDPRKVRRVTVVGSDKMAVYNDLANEEPIRIYDRRVESVPNGDRSGRFPVSYRYGDIISPFVAFKEPLLVQDQHFVDCISKGIAPQTNGESGLAVVEVLEAIDLSISQGRRVAVGTRWAGLVGA
jgi:predicted dehydrogenase